MGTIKRDKAAAIRHGQSLEKEKLEAYLRSEWGVPHADLEILQFPSGYSNLTYLLRFDGKEYVLRRPPHGAKIKSGHDMGREFTILSCLSKGFDKVPKPYLYSQNESLIGAPFYIMERVNGVILRSSMSREALPKAVEMRLIAQNFLASFTEIHQLDFKALGLGDLGRPEGYTMRQVQGWTKRYLAAKTHELDAMESAYNWLNKHIPDSDNAALIHNDFKYDNLILSADQQYNVKAVLDWEMATLGDPLMDLGTTLGYWVQDSDPDFVKANQLNLTTLAGNPQRSELLRWYEKQNAIDTSNIVFYYVFGLFKIAVIVQQIYYRYQQGFSTDKRFKELHKVVKIYGIMAHQAIQKKDIENLF